MHSALAFLQKGHELKIFIQILSGIGYALAHGEGCEDGADSESVDERSTARRAEKPSP